MYVATWSSGCSNPRSHDRPRPHPRRASTQPVLHEWPERSGSQGPQSQLRRCRARGRVARPNQRARGAHSPVTRRLMGLPETFHPKFARPADHWPVSSEPRVALPRHGSCVLGQRPPYFALSGGTFPGDPLELVRRRGNLDDDVRLVDRTSVPASQRVEALTARSTHRGVVQFAARRVVALAVPGRGRANREPAVPLPQGRARPRGP